MRYQRILESPIGPLLLEVQGGAVTRLTALRRITAAARAPQR